MKKIIFLLTFVISLLCFTNIVIATSTSNQTSANTTQGTGMMNNAKSTTGNVVNDIGQGLGGVINGAGNAINSIGDATKNVGRDIGSGINNMGDNSSSSNTNTDSGVRSNATDVETINDGTRNGSTHVKNTNNGTTDGTISGYGTTTGYDATRTAAGATTSNIWTWIVILVAVLAIALLIWYYNSENNKETRRKDRY